MWRRRLAASPRTHWVRPTRPRRQRRRSTAASAGSERCKHIACNWKFTLSAEPMNRCVYDDRYFTVVAPELPLNCREDGGHLILMKKEAVSDRSELSCQEAIDFIRITMIVGRAMYDVLEVERMNYEDLGNWGLDEPGGAKMHLHFFGRAREQIHQIRGQHIFFYPKDHKIYKGHLAPLNSEDLERLRIRIRELANETKYKK